MPERTAARGGIGRACRRRIELKGQCLKEEECNLYDTNPSTRVATLRQCWELPQDVGVLICQLIGAKGVVALLLAGRQSRDLGLIDEVWRYFCVQQWGPSANLPVYKSAKDLYTDRNGWFPSRAGARMRPRLDLQQLRLHDRPCLTMDLRMTKDEVIAVSEAPQDSGSSTTPLRKACVQIIDPERGCIRERFDVSDATINCCDVGPDMIFLGSDDSKVRVYHRSSASSFNGGGGDSYRLSSQFECASEVNDVRYTREGSIIAARTHQNRHPAGIDLIPIARPHAKKSFQGGSWATKGKYIHAIDGFEDACSLSAVTCSGEHPLTSAFSAMLFDFRRPAPCVLDLAVTSVPQGHPAGTMLWPLRAGRWPMVYANLLHENSQSSGGRHKATIAMIDFRVNHSTASSGPCIQLPYPVDDFRCFGGKLYAACTEICGYQKHMHIIRCSPEQPDHFENLHTVVEEYDDSGRSLREDLRVFSVGDRGFAASYREHLAVGTIADPHGAEWCEKAEFLQSDDSAALSAAAQGHRQAEHAFPPSLSVPAFVQPSRAPGGSDTEPSPNGGADHDWSLQAADGEHSMLLPSSTRLSGGLLVDDPQIHSASAAFRLSIFQDEALLTNR